MLQCDDYTTKQNIFHFINSTFNYSAAYISRITFEENIPIHNALGFTVQWISQFIYFMYYTMQCSQNEMSSTLQYGALRYCTQRLRFHEETERFQLSTRHWKVCEDLNLLLIWYVGPYSLIKIQYLLLVVGSCNTGFPPLLGKELLITIFPSRPFSASTSDSAAI